MLALDFTNKVVLVTGVSSGIGLGIAQMFAQAGATVVGCARSKDAPAFRDLSEQATVHYIQCDVSDSRQINSMMETIDHQFGRLDVLVSNAGRNVFEGAQLCTEQRWTENMELNLKSHWKVAQAAKLLLERQTGVIIVMTSNHAYSSIPGCFPYNVAKTALTGLVRSLAIEWSPQIRTVGIAPGFIDTEGNQTWFDSFPDPQAERLRTEQLHPVQRIGTAQEVGAWCVFLASDYAAFAAGTTYLLDGGRSALMQ